MNILVINGSPKGKYSITLQTLEFIKRKFQEDKYIPDNTKDVIKDILRQNRNVVIKIKTHK